MLAAMHETALLAGFFAAHGIWSVSDGETLTPLLGFELPSGERGMDRFVSDDIASGAHAGQEALHKNPRGAARAVLVADAYLNLDTGRTDALIVEAHDYSAGHLLRMAVPYRPKSSEQGFAVHRPKFMEVVGAEQGEFEALGDAFFAGVEAHEEAAEVWREHLDPSL